MARHGGREFELDDDEALQLRCGATLEDIGRCRPDDDRVDVGPGPRRVFGLDERTAPSPGAATPHRARPLPSGLELPPDDEGDADAVVVGVARGERGHATVRVSRRTFGTAGRPYRRAWVGRDRYPGRGAAFPDGARMRLSVPAVLEGAGGRCAEVTVAGSFALDADGLPVPGSLEARVEPVRRRTEAEARAEAAAAAVAARVPGAVAGRDAEGIAAEARRVAAAVTVGERMARIADRARREAAAAAEAVAGGRVGGGRPHVSRVGSDAPTRPPVRRR